MLQQVRKNYRRTMLFDCIGVILAINFQEKSCNIIYNFHVTGGSDDWAQGGAGIRYSFTMELPPRGNPGFVLPKEQILPVGREVFAGVAAMMNKLIEVTGNNDVGRKYIDFMLKKIFDEHIGIYLTHDLLFRSTSYEGNINNC